MHEFLEHVDRRVGTWDSAKPFKVGIIDRLLATSEERDPQNSARASNILSNRC